MEEYINGYEWEVIFVNDGSTDRSGEILEELSAEDSCCRVIELSKNFYSLALMLVCLPNQSKLKEEYMS